MMLSYICGAATYFIRRRPLLLVATITSNILGGIIAFSLLGEWSGLGVCAVAIVRDTVSYFVNQKRKEEEKNKITKLDCLWLAVWISALIVITVFTQNGILSWFYCFGSLVFTISIWQKNLLVYKLLGLIVGVFWIIYFVYVTPPNFFGIILESVLRLAVIAGLIIYFVNAKKEKSKQIAAEPVKEFKEENNQ